VIMAGEDETAKNEMTIKNMNTGEQKCIGFNELTGYFSASEISPGIIL